MTADYWLVAIMVSITGALIMSWIRMKNSFDSLKHKIDNIAGAQKHTAACFEKLSASISKQNENAVRQTTLLEQLVEETRLLRKQNGG